METSNRHAGDMLNNEIFMNKAKIMQLILFFCFSKTKFYFNSLQFKFHNATFFSCIITRSGRIP